MLNRLLSAILQIDMLVNRWCNVHARDTDGCRQIRDAAQVIRAAVLNGLIEAQPDDRPDPDKWVLAYIECDGDWQGLCAAVSRHTLAGAGRKMMQK